MKTLLSGIFALAIVMFVAGAMKVSAQTISPTGATGTTSATGVTGSTGTTSSTGTTGGTTNLPSGAPNTGFGY